MSFTNQEPKPFRMVAMKFKGIQCTINTTTGPMREYIDPDVAPNTPGEAIRYIQTQVGESFSFHIYILPGSDAVRPPANSLSCMIYINGNAEPSMAVYPGESVVHSSSTFGPATRGNWIKREFVFDKLTVTEDPGMIGALGNKKRKSEELGEIKVVWCRFNRTGIPDGSLWEEGGAADAVKMVHEKELKGRDIEHSVGFKESWTKQGVRLVPGRRLDTEDSPYAVMRFRYRSERALKSLGLIPRSPSASPVPDAPSGRPEEMSKDELIAELNKYRAGGSQLPLKQERRAETEQPETVSRARVKKRKVIDLTSD